MKMQCNLKTNAMGILPHEDIERAMALAMSLDIPFWPQLPKVSYYEDMYVQFSENFPGVVLDLKAQKLSFSTDKFYEDLPAFVDKMDDPDTFRLSKEYSRLYHKFLAQDLSGYPAIKGQTIGPISFGLKVVDEKKKPIIYNDEVRALLFDFCVKKVNVQYTELREKNPNAIVHIDEPGLELLFSAMTGYTNIMARDDLGEALKQVEGPKAIHLCGSPDWDFLLKAEIDILSFDAYNRGEKFVQYAEAVAFVEKGKTLSWGIVPTNEEDLKGQSVDSLVTRLEGYWAHLVEMGAERELLIQNALLAPATCCLIGARNVEMVEKAFDTLRDVSETLKQRYGLN